MGRDIFHTKTSKILLQNLELRCCISFDVVMNFLLCRCAYSNRYDCEKFTLSVWLNLGRPSQSDACLLTTAQQVNDTHRWSLVILHHRDAGLGVFVEYQTRTGFNIWSKQDIPVILNKWFHLVVVWERHSNVDMNLYMNQDPPIRVKAQLVYDPQILFNSSFRLGNITKGHDAALIDEVQLWARAMHELDVRKQFASGGY